MTGVTVLLATAGYTLAASAVGRRSSARHTAKSLSPMDIDTETAPVTPTRSNWMTLSSPRPGDIEGSLEEAIVRCLAAAFGSGVWAKAPMPFGNASDPHSARGIVAQLKARALVLVASATILAEAGERRRVIGCVLGGVLDEGLIDAYRLSAFGAKAGDALLAYIGVEPACQGKRALPLSDRRFAMRSRRLAPASRNGGESVAGTLFSRWLALPGVAARPRVFVRTRSVLRPVLHLIDRHGFGLRGKFELDFHGERQERLVFARTNRPKGSRVVPGRRRVTEPVAG